MEKCNICKEKIKETFLDKIDGTIIKKDSKKYYVCSTCQKEHKKDLKSKLK